MGECGELHVVKFATTMFQIGINTGIEVPAEVVAALDAGKRPSVVVSVDGYEYLSTVAPMGASISCRSAPTGARSRASKLEG